MGAVAATWVSVKTSFSMTAAGAKEPFLDLQKTLDGVYPGFLTALFVLLCWYLLSKKKNVTNQSNVIISGYCSYWSIGWIL